jgi:hypothetical protein
MTDAELNDLMAHLAAHPDAGASIKGTGGFRKIRWANSQRGKGKRSGSRTIYLHVGLNHTIHLMAIYDHKEKDDLLRDPLTSLQIVKSGAYMPDKTSHHFWQPLYFFQNIPYHIL